MGRPPRRGQPLNKGQDGGSERVRYSEVSLYINSLYVDMCIWIKFVRFPFPIVILWLGKSFKFIQLNHRLYIYYVNCTFDYLN